MSYEKLLIYIAAFAMILAMNTSCEDMGSLEEHPKKVDATTFMANAKEVESVINSIYSNSVVIRDSVVI